MDGQSSTGVSGADLFQALLSANPYLGAAVRGYQAAKQSRLRQEDVEGLAPLFQKAMAGDSEAQMALSKYRPKSVEGMRIASDILERAEALRGARAAAVPSLYERVPVVEPGRTEVAKDVTFSLPGARGPGPTGSRIEPVPPPAPLSEFMTTAPPKVTGMRAPELSDVLERVPEGERAAALPWVLKTYGYAPTDDKYDRWRLMAKEVATLQQSGVDTTGPEGRKRLMEIYEKYDPTMVKALEAGTVPPWRLDNISKAMARHEQTTRGLSDAYKQTPEYAADEEALADAVDEYQANPKSSGREMWKAVTKTGEHAERYRKEQQQVKQWDERVKRAQANIARLVKDHDDAMKHRAFLETEAGKRDAMARLGKLHSEYTALVQAARYYITLPTAENQAKGNKLMDQAQRVYEAYVVMRSQLGITAGPSGGPGGGGGANLEDYLKGDLE